MQQLAAHTSCGGLAIVLLAIATRQAGAQTTTPTLGPTPVVASLGAVHPATGLGAPGPPDTLEIAPSYWKEGALVGAGVLGLSSAILAAAFCDFDDSAGGDDCGVATVGGLVVGGALGFGIGALIGGMFPKPVPDPADPGAGPGEPDRRAWSATRILGTTLLATGAAFLGADLAGPLGAIGGVGLGVLVGSKLP